jgi:hypothetical protein
MKRLRTATYRETIHVLEDAAGELWQLTVSSQGRYQLMELDEEATEALQEEPDFPASFFAESTYGFGRGGGEPIPGTVQTRSAATLAPKVDA